MGDKDQWSYDHISAYLITKEIILTYLRDKFGPFKFYVERHGEDFRMWIPRKLLESEKIDLLRLRRSHVLESPESRDSDEPASNVILLEVQRHAPDIPTIDSTVQGNFGLHAVGADPDSVLTYIVSGTDTSRPGMIGAFRSESNSSRQGVANSLYAINVSEGFTSKVFEVDARWSWVSKDTSETHQPRSVKIGVKRLSKHTKPGQFLQEYNALKAATQVHHRNIVELLNAFRYEIDDGTAFYNFSFPLALCNLKDLFYYRPKPWATPAIISQSSHAIYSIARSDLWTEYQGLASALVHLHLKCQIAHSDIKPSNVLVYGPYQSPPRFTLKLTDFGLAVDLKTRLTWQLGSKESRSAWHYDAPDIRAAFKESQTSSKMAESSKIPHEISPEQLMSNDIWKLGSLFTELLTFLVKGRGSVAMFHTFITTTVDEFTSDELSDSRFDDGEKVKTEVLHWLSRLTNTDPRARDIHGLLISMLDIRSRRPSASHVLDVLKNSCLGTYFDGARILNFTPSEYVRSPSLLDLCKAAVENVVGQPVDWWPLSFGARNCPPNHSRISWLWFDQRLYIDVPHASAQAYKSRCQALSDIEMPSFQPPQSSAPGTHTSISGNHRPDSSAVNTNSPTGDSSASASRLRSGRRRDNQLDNHSTHTVDQSRRLSYKEIYWCVDKAWTEPRSTILCSLPKHTEVHDDGVIRDDESLYRRLLKEYNRVRSWKGRIFSWKSCLGIEFISFARTSTSRDKIIRLQTGLPPPVPPSYEITRLLPEELHMKIAAEELIAGIHQPEGGRDRTETLIRIPQRLRATTAEGTDSEDWGMHALSRFSLRKFLAWVVFLTILGLAFVIFWLVFIDKKDLQNAFIPFTFLATMIMIGLGVPQYLEVD